MTLDELEKLLAEATPGPWREEYNIGRGHTVWGPCGDTGSMLICTHGFAGTSDYKNALAVAATRNAAPALLAVARFVESLANKKRGDFVHPQFAKQILEGLEGLK